MNILNKLTIKHLKMNKKRTIVTIIGIILSTALMVGIGLICSTIREFIIDETISSYGNYHTIIKDVDSDKIKYFDKNKEINFYFYEKKLGYAKYNESTNEYKPYFRIQEVNKDYFEQLNLLEGEYPKNNNEILLSNHMFAQGNSKLEVGDTITLEYGRRFLNEEEVDDNLYYQEGENLKIEGKKEYKITGVVERSNFESYSSSGFYLFTLDDDNSFENANIYLNFKNPKKAIEVSKILYKNIKGESATYEEEGIVYSNIEYNDVLLSLYGTSQYDNINDFISTFLIIFLGIISVACAIVIYNSFAISVMERKKQFGLFTSIGATKSQIRKTVIFEAVLVGVIGVVLGIISAYIGIGTVVVIVNYLLKDILPVSLKLATYPLFVIIPTLFIIIVVFISSYLPARSASKISPIEVIRQNDEIKIKRKKIKTSKIVTKLFGVEGEIALKNIKRSKKKYRITIISLVISISTFLAFSTYLEYGKRSVSEFMQVKNYDIVVSDYNEKIQEDILEKFKNHEDVDSYQKVRRYMIYYERLNNEFYTKEYLEYFKREKNEYYNPGATQVVVLEDNKFLEYQEKIGVVDKQKFIIYNQMQFADYYDSSMKINSFKVYNEDKNLTLNICNFFGYELDEKDITKEYLEENCIAKINNFFYTNKEPDLVDLSYAAGVLIISESQEKILKDYKLDFYENIVYIKAEKQDNLDKLGDRYPEVDYYNYSKDAKLQRNILLTIEILFYGFITLVTLIGITSVFNTINTSINLRKREFAILRSVGLTPKGFNKMIAFESIFLGIRALLFGLPIGIILSILIVININEIITVEYLLPWKALVIVIFGIFIIILITMWYATSKIRHDNILESIREENI